MKLEILHRLRWLKQMIYTSEISVAGGYHLGNAGDILMGKSVQQLLEKFNRKGSLQTLYNLSKWPKAKKVILGGGAIGYIKPLEQLINCYPNPSNVLVLGVDFNEATYPEHIINYLKKTPILVTRSKANGQYLASTLNRIDIVHLPDLGFIWHNEIFHRIRVKPKVKRLIVNLMPIYMEKLNGSYKPIEQYRKERPDIYSNIEEIFKNYLTWAETIINEHRKNGFNIIAIPFTPADEELMRCLPFINKTEVLPYKTDLLNYLDLMISSETILSTRFHATVIGLRSFSKLIPFAYARKNEELLLSTGMSAEQFITPIKLLDPYNSHENLNTFDPIQISQLEIETLDSYYAIVEKFLKNL